MKISPAITKTKIENVITSTKNDQKRNKKILVSNKKMTKNH